MNILTKNSAANADAPNRSAVPMVPFDSGRLDKLMDEAGIDVLLVTSSTMSSISWEATASSSLTTWTRSGSAAICRYSST